MTTKEIAHSTIEQLAEEELEDFIAEFHRVHPSETNSDDQTRRDEAFKKLESLRKNKPNFDEKKALAEYREEKFG